MTRMALQVLSSGLEAVGVRLLGGLAQPRAKGWLRRAEDVGFLKRNVALAHAIMRLELVARQVLGEEHALTPGARNRREGGEHEKHTGMGRTPHRFFLTVDPTAPPRRCAAG